MRTCRATTGLCTCHMEMQHPLCDDSGVHLHVNVTQRVCDTGTVALLTDYKMS